MDIMHATRADAPLTCAHTHPPTHTHTRPHPPAPTHPHTQVARFMTPTPHGVGPTCAAALTLNTLTLAEASARRRDAEARHKARTAAGDLPAEPPSPAMLASVPQWSVGQCKQTGQAVLRRVFGCPTFVAAAQLIADMTVLAERSNHHPTLALNPSRTCEREGGCDVVVELSTYSQQRITAADVALAARFDALASCR